jgi:transposase
MAATTDGSVLFADQAGIPDGVVAINDRCRLRWRDGYGLVSVHGLPFTHFAEGDRVGEAHAMVSLVDLGWARQCEVAHAFGCDVRTVRRHQRRYEEGGLSALGRPPGFPRGRSRVSQGRQDAVNGWKAEGVSNREIARRLGVDEKAIRKLAKRLGWKERSAEQMTMPFESADSKLSAADEPRADDATPEAEGACATADPNRSSSDGQAAGAVAIGDPGGDGGREAADLNLSVSEADQEPPPVDSEILDVDENQIRAS